MDSKNKKINKLLDILSKKSRKIKNSDEKLKVAILNKIFFNHLNVNKDKSVNKKEDK